MRSYGTTALCLFLFAGLTIASDVASVVTLNSGENLETSVLTLAANVVGCYLDTPRGETIEFKPEDHSDAKYQLRADSFMISACQVTVRNVDSNDNGIWTLHSVSDSGDTISQSYQLTVNSAETTTEIITTEDVKTEVTDKVPTTEYATNTVTEQIKDSTVNVQTTETIVEATTKDIDVDINYLETAYLETRIGEVHTVTIPEFDFVTSEECYLITPEGERQNVEELNIYGIEAVNAQNVACGVKIHIVSEDQVGDWSLISRGTRFSVEVVERRQPIIIAIKEIVNALPTELTVSEGNHIYVRLEDATPLYESCKLYSPGEVEIVDAEKDPNHIETCGFIIRNADKSHSGYWKISYGVKTIYNAWIHVIVHGLGSTDFSTHSWTLDRPVDELVGPENAVYCKVVDAHGDLVFDGFGRCSISLPRVTDEHAGTWRAYVGLQGRVLTVEHTFEVRVLEGASKPVVSTNVATEKPLVTLTCSVSSPQPIRSCKFRDPAGNILLASPGVGEGRYTFSGSGASFSSGLHGYECGIQITNPLIADLGLWRCALETETDTYYGFLAALCPWAMRDPEVAATVQSEPLLQAEREIVTGVVGSPVTMSCSVQSHIRYCYFRARNGTTFTVSPGESTPFAEYAGAGFDAGECSIRFSNLLSTDSGRWSCHVGFQDPTEAEQRAQFDVNVQELLVAEQRVEKNALIITGRVHDNRPLDYCRFVRIDGLGFTTDNLPEGYRSDSLLSVGRCEIRIPSPSILERHPWTVAVRVRGHDLEYSQQSIHSLEMPAPVDPAEPPVHPEGPVSPIEVIYRMPTGWIIVIVVALVLILLGAVIAPRRNRQWTATKAARLRDSFRRSFSKSENIPAPEKSSPMAA